MNLKFIQITPPPTDPGFGNETTQEFNGAFTLMAVILDGKTLTVAVTVVANLVIVVPVINPPLV